MSDHTKVPSYRRHSSGQARVILFDALTGRKQEVHLGKFGTPASRAAYGRVIAKWEESGRRLDNPVGPDLTINEFLLEFWNFALSYYRNEDGSHTGELENLRYAIRPLRELFGDTAAAEFGPMKLKAVRQKMIDSGLCRSQVNARTNRIRRAFKWAVENEMIPGGVVHALQTVQGIRHGRGVREAEPVGPVPISTVEQTLPFLNPPIAAVVRLLMLTGARTGEILAMRSCDLDTSGRVWVYRPSMHKTSHHGKRREIYLGPQAQEVVKPWLKLDLQAFIFSPKDAQLQRREARAASRTRNYPPSYFKALARKRATAKSRRSPYGTKYKTSNIWWAIRRACRKAFPPVGPFAPIDGECRRHWLARLSDSEREQLVAWERDHSWHPHQLRHTAGTLLRKEFGIELARIILGHSTAFTTEIYAETDRQQAMEVIGKIG